MKGLEQMIVTFGFTEMLSSLVRLATVGTVSIFLFCRVNVELDVNI